jgi:hydroxymethylbilane synthase
MSNKTKYKIGTRGSLLAVTQCTLIANEMSDITGSEFELVKISTQGDQQTEKPLWQMDGKDFFTKELDSALLANEVDLVVHSYKDLGSDRPEGIGLATITQRKFANDILLIKKENISKIKDLDTFIVGTSSPRRIVNIESSLKPYLPKIKESTKVKCEMLRGNVNTRIQKLKDDKYHAIVLALAGLERLANKEDSKEELTRLLDGLTFIVLPQKDFPSSASQGALAIEYNSNRDDKELLKVLKSVHCDITEKEISREREAFKSYGGGCHLAVGINVQAHKNYFLKIEKGIHEEKEIHNVSLEGVDYSSVQGHKTFVALGKHDRLISQAELPADLDGNNYFVTSRHCISALKNSSATLWASGTRTLKKLVEAGFWVSGSAGSLGHNEIEKLNSSKAIQLMVKNNKVEVLSHDNATSPIGKTIPCYKRVISDAQFEPDQYEVFYWNSFFQYETYIHHYPEIKSKIHACGLGKTYDQFKLANINIIPFADMKTLKKICNTNL